jgi:hypothetical protein
MVHAPTVLEPMSAPLPETGFTVGDRYVLRTCWPDDRRTGPLLGYIQEQTGAHALTEITIDRASLYVWWLGGLQVSDCVTVSAVPVQFN